MKMLNEYFELCPNGTCQDFLTEDEKRDVRENGTMYLTGVIQRAEAPNGNNRVYSKKVLEREIENYQKLIQENRALGELDHPEDSVINLRNVSHNMVKVWWDGNNVMGKAKILNTPSGKILQSLVNDGIKLGISSRGMGSVHEGPDGRTIVEDDFNLICFDFVSEPSTHGAFMDMRENKTKPKLSENKANKIGKLLNKIIKD